MAGAGAEVAGPERCDCPQLFLVCAGAGAAGGGLHRAGGRGAPRPGGTEPPTPPPPRGVQPLPGVRLPPERGGGGGARGCFTAGGSFAFLRSLSASELPGGGELRGEEAEGEETAAGSVKRRQLNDSGCSPRPQPAAGQTARPPARPTVLPAMEGREEAECDCRAAFAEARRWVEVR